MIFIQKTKEAEHHIPHPYTRLGRIRMRVKLQIANLDSAACPETQYFTAVRQTRRIELVTSKPLLFLYALEPKDTFTVFWSRLRITIILSFSFFVSGRSTALFLVLVLVLSHFDLGLSLIL
jgi:hypothetical protein